MTDDAIHERFERAAAALFARRPEHMLPGLGRIEALCRELGQPQHAFTSMQLTGTNGKTSLARIVSAVLQAHGQRAGAYTSPHLQDVRERIRIDGEPISKAEFVEGCDAVKPHIDAVEAARGELVTFFEALTALAYRRFAAGDVDVAVVEVGMGGRWDATSVVAPDVSVINPVRLDHAELGATVEEVAWEKAGIVAQGGVCISAEQDPGARRVIEAEARSRAATLLFAGEDFAVRSREPHVSGQRLSVALGSGVVDALELPLHGTHQARNAAVALAACEALLGGLDPEAARAGISAVRSPGRLEVVDGAVPVLLDGAHNPAGAQALAHALKEDWPGRRRVVVLGAMGDKDVAGIVEALVAAADEVVCTQAVNLRAAPAEQLAKLVAVAGCRAHVEPDVAAAVELARERAGSGGTVVVTGSLYVVGAAREALGLQVA